MNEFKQLNRDVIRENIPTGMWEFARNLLLTKKKGSISNEYGFLKQLEFPGSFIGGITTNIEKVIYSVDSEFSYIGIIKNNNPTVYIPIIKSRHLGFELHRPIESSYFYNHKNHLIVVFCNGIHKDSITPKYINLTTIGELLDGALEIEESKVDLLSLFVPVKEALVDIEYIETTISSINSVYITYAYLHNDGITHTPFFPVHHIAYPSFEYINNKKKGIAVTLKHLDSKFEKVIVGIVVNDEKDGLVAYRSSPFIIKNDSVEFTLENLAAYSRDITVEELVVPYAFYEKARTLTFQNEQLQLGNVIETDISSIQDKIQKHINNLQLDLYLINENALSIPDQLTHATLMPDEVYAIYIEPQLLNGTYLQAFPLIAPDNSLPTSRDVLTIQELGAMGLGGGNDLDEHRVKANEWKRFHIENPVPNIPALPANIVIHKIDWGFWENEETYPNVDHFNSSIDYDGNPMSGDDLRNVPIRYFRVPGLDMNALEESSLFDKTKSVPSIGRTSRKRNGVKTTLPRFGVKIANFEDVIPDNIKEELQGYRLLIVKRTQGNRLVEDNGYLQMLRLYDNEIITNSSKSLIPYFGLADNPIFGDAAGYTVTLFGMAALLSSNSYHYKPSLGIKVVKANYAVDRFIFHANTSRNIAPIDYNEDSNVIARPRVDSLAKQFQYYRIPPSQKYGVLQRTTYLKGNNSAMGSTFMPDMCLMNIVNFNQPDVLESGTSGETYGKYRRWNPLLATRFQNSSSFAFQVRYPVLYPKSATGITLPDTEENVEDHRAVNMLLNVTILNLRKNLYEGFNPKDFISLGRVDLNNKNRKYGTDEEVANILASNGDVFFNNALNIAIAYVRDSVLQNQQVYLPAMYGYNNNSLAYTIVDRRFDYRIDPTTEDGINALNSFNYEVQLYNKEGNKALNDYISAIAYSFLNNIYIDKFPFRIIRSLTKSSESLSNNNIRTFLSNSYYDMPNTRGQVIAIRGTNRTMYIQQQFSLFIAMIKDVLSSQAGENATYIGRGDLFDREPEEVYINKDKGYIGCTSQIACIITPAGIVIIDQVKGKIFIVGQSPLEISAVGLTNTFQDELLIDKSMSDVYGEDLPIDNAFTQVGHLVGYDEKQSRLLFTKKNYYLKEDVELEYDKTKGMYYRFEEEDEEQTTKIYIPYNNPLYFIEQSKTYSYDFAENRWICEHDYFPNAYLDDNRGIYGITNESENPNTTYSLYKLFDKAVKRGEYFNNKNFESYVDLVFNTRLDLSKLYQNISWESVVRTIADQTLYNKTIDKIALYSNYQSTGIIELEEFKNCRNIEGVWNFNSFRDIAISSTLPLVETSTGKIVEESLNINKGYFDKSSFIGTFVVVRLIMSNNNTNDVYINFVNVKSRTSNR